MKKKWTTRLDRHVRYYRRVKREKEMLARGGGERSNPVVAVRLCIVWIGLVSRGQLSSPIFRLLLFPEVVLRIDGSSSQWLLR